MKQSVHTDRAPAAIGAYSQGIVSGDHLYLSGQIPLDPRSGEIIDGDIAAHIEQIFDNLAAVAAEANAGLDDIVKLTVFLTDLVHFPVVNQVMERRFSRPYPARAAVQVAALPKGVDVEMDAIVALSD